MKIYLQVKNFAKIKTAEIMYGDFTVFVGNNNSGKTLMMQLLYGIQRELEHFTPSNYGYKVSCNEDLFLISCESEWFRATEESFNAYLDKNKQKIIRDIFGLDIPIESIKIHFKYEDTERYVSSITGESTNSKYEFDSDKFVGCVTRHMIGKEEKEVYNYLSISTLTPDGDMSHVLQDVWRIVINGKVEEARLLFIPASRSGLQMLFRHYFVNNVDENIATPVKDFLRFLQLFSTNTNIDSNRQALLRFGEEKLLSGKVIQQGDETFYIGLDGKTPVPLYIASSMIHELTPFMKALSTGNQVEWLYCDEVENSLHPLVQREMARWLIRMVNSGMHITISSHSDTMASRLNNLLMLTHLYLNKKDGDLLYKLGLEEKDLLKDNAEIHIFEFQNVDGGGTTVQELEFISEPLIGYDFQLFGNNLDKLYNEADLITR